MTLAVYIGKRFIFLFLLVVLGLALLFFISELEVHLDRYRNLEETTIVAIGMSLLKTVEQLYEVLPIAVGLAALAMSIRLSVTSEIVVARAAGMSALATLLSPALVAAAIGVVSILALNPFVAQTSKQYRLLTEFHSQKDTQVTFGRGEIIWLRQVTETGQAVIRAAHFSEGHRFTEMDVFEFDQDGVLVGHHTASSGILDVGSWKLYNAKSWNLGIEAEIPEETATRSDTLMIPTNLTIDQISESFDSPHEIPFWEIPELISRLEQAGLSSLEYRVYLQREFAKPILLAAMALIGAGFALRFSRFSRLDVMAVISVVSVMAVYFLQDFAKVLGENGEIPTLGAAWIPPLAVLLLSVSLLLFAEEF